MTVIRREIDIFFTALTFYTQIPAPKGTEFSPEMLNQATRYFPLIGILVGGIGALVFWSLALILPLGPATLLSMAATILATGAFHEDGFADFCDGFGGGYTPERILEIMKDSRIGTYGTSGLSLMLLTKFTCLCSMQRSEIPLVLISAHAFSRLLPVCLVYTSTYVRQDALSKARPIGHRGSACSLGVAALFGLSGLALLPCRAGMLIAACACVLFPAFRGYITRRAGGYTGDMLGALQQLAEATCYLAYLACQHTPA